MCIVASFLRFFVCIVRSRRSNSSPGLVPDIQDLLEWTRDEFDPLKYSSKISSDPETLRIEIKNICNDKLEKEWVKFGFYVKKNEEMHRLCMFVTMVNAAEVNLKYEENWQQQELTTP